MPARSQRYKVDELVALTRPRDKKPKILAMLEAYLDESGIHGGAAVCVIGGYFGLASQWKWFEKKWKAALHEHGLALEDFHAKDLVNQYSQRPFLQGLAGTIAKYQLYPICAGIIVDDFNSFTEDQRRWMTGASAKNGKLISSGAPTKPYFVPFQHCLRMVTADTPMGRKANFFFGLDKQMFGWANALFSQIKCDPHHAPEWPEKKRLGDPAYPLASETPQLQAADFLVHLSYKHMLERLTAKDWSVVPSEPLLTCIRNAKRPESLMFQNRACLEVPLSRCSIPAIRDISRRASV